MGEISDEERWATAPSEREQTPVFPDPPFAEDDLTPNLHRTTTSQLSENYLFPILAL